MSTLDKAAVICPHTLFTKQASGQDPTSTHSRPFGRWGLWVPPPPPPQGWGGGARWPWGGGGGKRGGWAGRLHCWLLSGLVLPLCLLRIIQPPIATLKVIRQLDKVASPTHIEQDPAWTRLPLQPTLDKTLYLSDQTCVLGLTSGMWKGIRNGEGKEITECLVHPTFGFLDGPWGDLDVNFSPQFEHTKIIHSKCPTLPS